MAGKNVYDVHLDNGRKHEVETPHHHDDHDAKTWQNHMVDLLKNVAAGGTVNRNEKNVFKGRR